MTRNKIIKLLILIISIITIIYIIHMSIKILDIEGKHIKNIINSTRLIMVTLSYLIVVFAYKFYLFKKDYWVMLGMFFWIMIGDILFVLNYWQLAIVAFLICQIFITYRNYIINSEKNFYNDVKLFKTALLVCLLMLVIYIFILYPFIKDNKFLRNSFFIYSLILSIALYSSIRNYILNLYPKKNNFLILIGVIFFYISDLCVGLNLVLYQGSIKSVVKDLVWLLYVPALVLLSLSTYNGEIYKDKR